MSEPSFLEKDVELAAITAIREVITDRPVSGFWNPILTDVSATDQKTCVEVTCSPRTGSWGSGIISLTIDINAQSDIENDVQGTRLATAFKALVGLLATWQANEETAATALSVPGVFRADAVLISGGDKPGADEALEVWFASVSIEVKGVIEDPVTP